MALTKLQKDHLALLAAPGTIGKNGAHPNRVSMRDVYIEMTVRVDPVYDRERAGWDEERNKFASQFGAATMFSDGANLFLFYPDPKMAAPELLPVSPNHVSFPEIPFVEGIFALPTGYARKALERTGYRLPTVEQTAEFSRTNYANSIFEQRTGINLADTFDKKSPLERTLIPENRNTMLAHFRIPDYNPDAMETYNDIWGSGGHYPRGFERSGFIESLLELNRAIRRDVAYTMNAWEFDERANHISSAELTAARRRHTVAEKARAARTAGIGSGAKVVTVQH